VTSTGVGSIALLGPIFILFYPWSGELIALVVTSERIAKRKGRWKSVGASSVSSAWDREADLASGPSWGCSEGRTKYPQLEKIRGGTAYQVSPA